MEADEVEVRARDAEEHVARRAELVDRVRASGPMADVPLSFVMALVGTMADATTDAIIRDPEQGQACSEVAFQAVWRVLAGQPLTTSPTPEDESF